MTTQTRSEVAPPNAGAVAGKLNPLAGGASMPVDAPYYQSPPFHYRDAQAMAIAYETDSEAAAAMLPEGLELPSPAVATLSFLRYPFSTFGPYDEVILGIICRWQDEPCSYIAHIVVNTVPPLVAGREIWGYPKKLARIEIAQDEEMMTGVMERPDGIRIASAAMRIESPLEVGPPGRGAGLSLRVIPSVEEGKPPSLAELIATRNTTTVHEAWSGTGTVAFEGRSALDPWHLLPAKRVLSTTFRRFDMVLPHGEVIRTYG
ncbi:MAG: acetoacetate decarboxylase family protein [Dehalococcoidia bacterium]